MVRGLYFLFLTVSCMILFSCANNQPKQIASPAEPDNDAQEGLASKPIQTDSSVLVLPTSTYTPLPNPSATPTPWIPRPLMGVESYYPEEEQISSLLVDSGSQVVRYGSVLWNEVEPQEGLYNWGALQKLETALQELAAGGFNIILIVRGTPDWAQKVPGAFCGPISEEKISNFSNFMIELVRRYSAPPYNVRYWEIGNEPDVDPMLVPQDSGFGCWGDSQDINYGGGYYADMLKVVYPAIKSVDSSAQVMIGGLLLDCDPYNPPDDKDCLSSRFFSGILANGGADYFDIVGFHGYPFYFKQSLSMEWTMPGWESRGGVIVGKIDYLREVMDQYQVDKPIFLTESSLLCPEWNQSECLPPDEKFFEVQADYVVRLYVRNWALDVNGTIWYSFEGQSWRYGGLVGRDPNDPNPAYNAFKYLNQKLKSSTYSGKVPFSEGVDGYIFSNSNDSQTWVLWSQDESPQSIELPSNLVAVYDKYGQEIGLDGTQIVITSPIYFDVSP